jgi:hypothetical protein
MTNHLRLTALSIALAGTLAACGSQSTTTPLARATASPAPGASATPGAGATATPGPAGVTSTSFVIALAGGTGATIQSARRNPKFISQSTQSISYAVDGGATATQNLSTSAANCAASNGGVACTVPLAGVAAGNHTLNIAAWDGASGTGNTLGRNSAISFTVVANQANTVSAILGANATSMTLVSVNGRAGGSMSSGYTMLTNGQPQGFTAEPLDADGNVVVGPGAPVITESAGNSSFTTTAGTIPNTFSVTIKPTQITGPLKSLLGSLTFTLNPVANSGGSTLRFNAQLSVVQPYLYALLDTNQVVAFDELGNTQAHPNASDGINAQNTIGLAYAPLTSSLVGMTATAVNAFNYAGENQTGSLPLGAVTPRAGVFTWDTISNTGYGFDSTSNKLFQVGPGANGTTVSTTGPAQANPYLAIQPSMLPFENTISASQDILFVASLHSLNLIANDGTPGSTLSQPPVGPISGMAYDPVNLKLFVSGVLGVAVVADFNLIGSSFTGNGGPSAIAFDPYNGFVYVAEASTSVVNVYNSTGALQFTFPLPAGSAATQMVIAPAGV